MQSESHRNGVNKEVAASDKAEHTVRTDFHHPYPLSVSDVSLHTVTEEEYTPKDLRR